MQAQLRSGLDEAEAVEASDCLSTGGVRSCMCVSVWEELIQCLISNLTPETFEGG